MPSRMHEVGSHTVASSCKSCRNTLRHFAARTSTYQICSACRCLRACSGESLIVRGRCMKLLQPPTDNHAGHAWGYSAATAKYVECKSAAVHCPRLHATVYSGSGTGNGQDRVRKIAAHQHDSYENAGVGGGQDRARGCGVSCCGLRSSLLSLKACRPTREIAAAMAKTVRAECESAKVAVRHARRGALEQAKALKEKDAKRDFEKQARCCGMRSRLQTRALHCHLQCKAHSVATRVQWLPALLRA